MLDLFAERVVEIDRRAFDARTERVERTTGLAFGALALDARTEPAPPAAPRPVMPSRPSPSAFERATQAPRPQEIARPAPAPMPTPVRPAVTPMTSAAARFAVEPPPPIIKPRATEQQPKPPAEPTAGQIFTF